MKEHNKPNIFVDATKDRVGCQITNELYAMYHCYKNDKQFIGSVCQYASRYKEHSHMVEFLNLPFRVFRDHKERAKFCADSIHMRYNDYHYSHGPVDRKHERIFAKDEKFISHIHESFDHVRSDLAKQHYRKRPGHHVVCHIRRGDVQHNRNRMRYFDNQYYIDILSKIKKTHPGAVITIHTYGKWNDPKQPFIDMGCEIVHITGGNNYKHAINTWSDMIFCDTLITSKSGFSYVPALFNVNNVIHTEAGSWHARERWKSPDEV